ncbi:flavodoxin family protein [Thermodesulfobacteriota bacterium]
MKITTILGSPRKNGNTAKVLGRFEELADSDHEVDHIHIASHDVKGCLGCGACEKSCDEPGCVQKDEAMSIFERMMRADVVVYASPLYCWGFSSQIKALIDRHYCLVKGYGTEDYRSFVEGKQALLLVTCDGPIEDNADLIQELFARLCSYGKCEAAGNYIVPFCSAPDTIDTTGMDTAGKMAADISGLSPRVRD